VRRHTKLDKNLDHITKVGDPLVTPFALMGLRALHRSELANYLDYARFIHYGLDAVVVDLTLTTRVALASDWQHQLEALLSALDAAPLPRRPPIVVLCEEAFIMRRADLVLRKHAKEAKTGRARPLKHGAVLLQAGLLQTSDTIPELPPVQFTADVKDASLAPLRDRLIGLMRRLREAGHTNAATAVGKVLHALSSFASLPIGITEARSVAGILFDGDGREEVEARSPFFPTSALQPMAEITNAAPEFEADIRQFLDEVKSRTHDWEHATPISLKLAQLLSDPEWNACDVLLVLPDARTTDVFLVSDGGVGCACRVIEASDLTERVTTDQWRRIVIVRPEPKTVRILLTMHASSSRVLLLGDAAGASLIAVEVKPLLSLPEFVPFAARAAALSAALDKGGATEKMHHHEVEFYCHIPTSENLIDLTQAADGYTGNVIRFQLEGGRRVAYRPESDVLVFTPDEVRRFHRVDAHAIQVGDSILVLRKDIRDKLSEALLRSRKTAGQLKLYHQEIVRFRERLPGNMLMVKARHCLARMQAIDPLIGEHEVPNIARWLSVKPSDSPQQPRAARDQRRFSVFMKAAEINETLTEAYWNFAVLPVRAYSAQEGHLFNRLIVQFIMDPEGVAVRAGWREYKDLWQAIVDSVERVTYKEICNG
jgi:hypothetical protein